MPKPFITEDQRIRQNVNRRQRLKKSWDKHCKYGAEDNSSDMFTGNFAAVELDFQSSKDNYIRLLDEGVVVDGNQGFAYAVIAKGAIKEWYDNLPEDFEGHIDYDHIQAMKLGKFHKSDLRLVELGDDRYGVDVNVKLDNNLYLVKDILRNNTAHAVSSEFYSTIEKFVGSEEVTGEKGEDTYPVPILKKLDIFGYAIVDNPKNANSYDDKILEKASNSERTVMPDEVKAEAKEEVVETAEEVVETPAEEAPAEEAPAETEVEASAEAEEETSTEEEAEAPAEEEAPAEPEAEEADDASEKVEASIEKIGEKIEALQAELKAKDAKIAELEAKLSADKEKKHTLAAKLEGFLNFAEADAPTEAEGKATTTEETESKDEYSAALENAFKEM